MKILVVSPICPDAVDSLRRQHDVICAFNAPQDEIQAKIVDRDILVFRSGPDINAAVMDCAPDLSLLIRAGSGLDNLDIEHAVSRDIALARIERPGARAVAELSFSFMLALARQVPKADAMLRQGHWVKHVLTGYLLSGKTLGIYGAGNIGTQVGRMGAAWGMHVIGCVEHYSENRVVELQNQGIQLVETNEVLANADFLSIHLPLQRSTRNLLDMAALARMKSSAFLLNLARGGIVNEQALLQALTDGKLAGAGIDVHEHEGEGKVSPLAELPNVILTPHIGAGTVDTQRAIGQEILQLITAHAATRG